MLKRVGGMLIGWAGLGSSVDPGSLWVMSGGSSAKDGAGIEVASISRLACLRQSPDRSC